MRTTTAASSTTSRRNDFTLSAGDLTVRLAAEFGFCYGVDRAVDYAYETRTRFPDRHIYITGEIIHNPHVNQRLREMGIRFLSGRDPVERGWEALGPRDVVILPAFGVTVEQMNFLRERGCTLVDTTCGSVLNVWKNVERYARDGFTSVIHGKYNHEETRATASRTSLYPAGNTWWSGTWRRPRRSATPSAAGETARPSWPASLRRSLKGSIPAGTWSGWGWPTRPPCSPRNRSQVAEEIRLAMIDRYGEAELSKHFRSFDTICSATQDRQDAVRKLLEGGVSMMLVIGGYNSSNTNNLAELSAGRVPTYHIEDASCLVDASTIRHKPVGGKSEETRKGWLPDGPLVIGITAGASTPNNRIGEVVERILQVRGIEAPDLPHSP